MQDAHWLLRMNDLLHLRETDVAPRSLGPLLELLDQDQKTRLERCVASARRLLARRVTWNVNSTAIGGGVAEMLTPILAYARGAGIDMRWLVIGGDEPFFQVTKRLHNYLHGDPGDGGIFGAEELRAYGDTIARNARELAEVISPGDVVILHDPQTAGLCAPLRARGAAVIWRSHIGAESVNKYVVRGWEFLRPLIAEAHAYVFSRRASVPPELDAGRVQIIPPSIDPLSPKNQPLAPHATLAILRKVGLVGGESSGQAATFRRLDGSWGRIDHHCDIQRTGPPPSLETPLVVQVSRWDRLKDPLGVMHGFAERVVRRHSAHLVLAGPTVRSVADDPESREVLDEVEWAWRKLPHFERSRIHLACLPMADVEENGAIVNALQRHAAVIVQKSLQEGFGLTVTEAMWKGRSVVASAVGGIQDQIEDGTSGLLLPDPHDGTTFGRLVERVLSDQPLAERLGKQAQQHVQQHFLVSRTFTDYFQLLERLIQSSEHVSERDVEDAKLQEIVS